MVLAAGFGHVGRIAVEGEPEVFDYVVAKGFPDATVEFKTGGVGCTVKGVVGSACVLNSE